ncbi:DNA mismatch repair protein MutS-like isoform X2 [Zophobas morio]|uniref:DNA mismatch repair protein MutS-like isoform X2 n=1 Tax=Zophobas morio TaxID=2755281 RepID=UPI00308295BB
MMKLYYVRRDNIQKCSLSAITYYLSSALSRVACVSTSSDVSFVTKAGFKCLTTPLVYCKFASKYTFRNPIFSYIRMYSSELVLGIPKTRMERQYYEVHRQFQPRNSFLILFQCGDFYEIYNEDAVDVNKSCGLKLVHKKHSFFKKMCGFPVRNLENWVETILKNTDKKVIICEQKEVPSRNNVKEIERIITRIITPGTMGEYALDGDRNYLMAIHESESPDHVSLAYVDVCSGEIVVHTGTFQSFEEIVSYTEPSELLAPSDIQLIIKRLATSYLKECYYSDCDLHALDSPNPAKSEQRAKWEALLDTVPDFSASERKVCRMLFSYLEFTFIKNLPEIHKISRFEASVYLQIDAETRRALELLKGIASSSTKVSLYKLLDRCRTKAGRRELKTRVGLPYAQMDVITKKQACVGALYSAYASNALGKSYISSFLRECADVERVLYKISQGKFGVSEMLQLLSTCESAAEFYQSFSTKLSANEKNTEILLEDIRALNSPFYKSLGGLFNDDGELTGDKRLRQLRSKMDAVQEGLFSLEKHIRELSPLVDHLTLREHPDFIYCLEASSKRETAVRQFIEICLQDAGLDTAFTPSLKQSTRSVVRYSCPALERLIQQKVEIEKEFSSYETVLLSSAINSFQSLEKYFIKLGKALARLDYYDSLARVAFEEGFSRPTLLPSDHVHFDVIGGFHPVVRKLRQRNAHIYDNFSLHFVENDCSLGGDKSLWMITGPNMGGKSTFMRQNALILVLAQMGSFVPARKAKLGIAVSLFARVGAHDDITQNMSTFMIEMSETARILKQATSSSLVILDEVGRGTGTRDGTAIAIAVLRRLHDIGCRTLAATHYEGLDAHLSDCERLQYYQSQALVQPDGEVVFTYKMVPGLSNKSYGIEAASQAGLPESVIREAKRIAKSIEQGRDGQETTSVEQCQ